VEVLGLLKAYSFISAQVNNSIFSLHQLVHLATRNWLWKKESLKSWVEKAAIQLDKIFPDSDHDNQPMWREYLPHALYLANTAEFQAYHNNHDDFIARIGSCLQSDGRYGEAEIIFRTVLDIRESVCGPDKVETLTSVSQVGSVLAEQGKYKEVEAMHQRALQGCKKVLGPKHPNTLISISHLGSVLAGQGKYKEAEAMHERAL
jgi:tetratricopeptide (TPR) repeat protein